MSGLAHARTPTGTFAWSARGTIATQTTGAPQSISCPTDELCVGLDEAGNVFTTTTPAAAARWPEVDADVTGTLACPSATLCVDAGGEHIRSTTDPTATRWTTDFTDPAGADYGMLNLPVRARPSASASTDAGGSSARATPAAMAATGRCPSRFPARSAADSPPGISPP